MNELDKAYTQGFVDKCAEAGVDPELVVKHGFDPAIFDPRSEAAYKHLTRNDLPAQNPDTSNVRRGKPMKQPGSQSSFVVPGMTNYSGSVMKRLGQIGTGERSSAKTVTQMPSGPAMRNKRRAKAAPQSSIGKPRRRQ